MDNRIRNRIINRTVIRVTIKMIFSTCMRLLFIKLVCQYPTDRAKLKQVAYLFYSLLYANDAEYMNNCPQQEMFVRIQTNVSSNKFLQ